MEYHPGHLSHAEEQEVRYSLPVGSYVYGSIIRQWYVINEPAHSSAREPKDVPSEYRAHILLLQ